MVFPIGICLLFTTSFLKTCLKTIPMDTKAFSVAWSFDDRIAIGDFYGIRIFNTRWLPILSKNITKKESFDNLNNEFPVLQFIDGQFSKELSSLPNFISIESVLNKEENFQPSHAVKYDSSSNPFAYLNSAFLNIGYVIKITKSSDLPIIIESKMSEKSENLMIHPKFIIKSSNNVDATIYESYVGENAFYLNNVSTEFIIGNNSHIKHYRSQLESNRAYHIANSNYNISN